MAMGCSRNFVCPVRHYSTGAGLLSRDGFDKNARRACQPYAKLLKDFVFPLQTKPVLVFATRSSWLRIRTNQAHLPSFIYSVTDPARENPARRSCRPCRRPPACGRG